MYRTVARHAADRLAAEWRHIECHAVRSRKAPCCRRAWRTARSVSPEELESAKLRVVRDQHDRPRRNGKRRIQRHAGGHGAAPRVTLLLGRSPVVVVVLVVTVARLLLEGDLQVVSPGDPRVSLRPLPTIHAERENRL
jgi:hypothetical protein